MTRNTIYSIQYRYKKWKFFVRKCRKIFDSLINLKNERKNKTKSREKMF